MIIDLRKDAPDQTDNLDPEKLSQEVEKLKTIQNQIVNLETGEFCPGLPAPFSSFD